MMPFPQSAAGSVASLPAMSSAFGCRRLNKEFGTAVTIVEIDTTSLEASLERLSFKGCETRTIRRYHEQHPDAEH
jgi:hypothetical protein